MERKKLLKFFVGGGLIGLVIIAVYWAVTGGVVVEQEVKPFPTSISFPTVTAQPGTRVSPAIQLPPIRQGKFVIAGVEVEDFLVDPLVVNSTGDVLFADHKDYRLTYSSGREEFFVLVVGSPFRDARRAAEAEFLRRLGIVEAEACRLSVGVGTPQFANPEFAGKEYGLSFCES